MKKIKFIIYCFLGFCLFCNNVVAQDTLYQDIVTSPTDDLASGDSKVYLADGVYLFANNQLLSGASGHYYSEHPQGILFTDGLFATTGSELFATTLEIIDMEVSNKDLYFNGHFQLFSNPTTDQLQGEYELENDGVVSFRIFNAQGIELLTPITNQQTSTGKHQFQFDIQNLASGSYFLVFSFNEKIHIEKVTKIQ